MNDNIIDLDEHLFKRLLSFDYTWTDEQAGAETRLIGIALRALDKALQQTPEGYCQVNLSEHEFHSWVGATGGGDDLKRIEVVHVPKYHRRLNRDLKAIREWWKELEKSS
jgi:hypothetical protein